jgi:small subunit ribosomal protein S17
MIGRVVSVKTKNTATVLVTTTKTHPLYRKTFVRTKKFLADDQLGVNLGQIVEIVSIKPVSKRKAWKVTKVVGRDIEAIVSQKLQEQAAEIVSEVMPEEEKVEKESEIKSLESSEKEVKTENAKVKKPKKEAKTSL